MNDFICRFCNPRADKLRNLRMICASNHSSSLAIAAHCQTSNTVNLKVILYTFYLNNPKTDTLIHLLPSCKLFMFLNHKALSIKTISEMSLITLSLFLGHEPLIHALALRLFLTKILPLRHLTAKDRILPVHVDHLRLH